jgi:hypothetical protein
MKNIITVGILIFSFVLFVNANVVESTSNGGRWSNPKSWSNNTIPTKYDDVVISGKIIADVNTTCNNINIENTGMIEINITTPCKIFTVSQNFILNGELKINLANELKVLGSLTNNSKQIKNEGIIEVGQNLEQKVIESTANGGNWSDINTWENKNIPKQYQDVIIKGNVNIDISGNCQNITVSENGNLIIDIKTGERIFTVNNNLKNDGNIIIGNDNTLKIINKIWNNNEITNNGIIETEN